MPLKCLQPRVDFLLDSSGLLLLNSKVVQKCSDSKFVDLDFAFDDLEFLFVTLTSLFDLEVRCSDIRVSELVGLYPTRCARYRTAILTD